MSAAIEGFMMKFKLKYLVLFALGGFFAQIVMGAEQPEIQPSGQEIPSEQARLRERRERRRILNAEIRQEYLRMGGAPAIVALLADIFPGPRGMDPEEYRAMLFADVARNMAEEDRNPHARIMPEEDRNPQGVLFRILDAIDCCWERLWCCCGRDHDE